MNIHITAIARHGTHECLASAWRRPLPEYRSQQMRHAFCFRFLHASPTNAMILLAPLLLRLLEHLLDNLLLLDQESPGDTVLDAVGAP